MKPNTNIFKNRWVAFGSYLAALTFLQSCGGAQTDIKDKVIIISPDTATISETEDTSLAISSGEAKGTSAVIPPGALAIGSTLSLEPIASPDEFDLAAIESAGAAIKIGASTSSGSQVSELSSPMTLSLPLGGTGLALSSYFSLVDKKNENLCVFLSSSSKLIVWRSSSISIATENGIQVAKIKSLKLGIFQLVYCGTETLAGFEEAISAGADGSGAKISVTIDTSKYDFNQDKICVAVLGDSTPEDKNDSGNGTGSSGSENGDGPDLMFGGSEITIDGKKAVASFTANTSVATTDDAESFLILMYMDSSQDCPDASPTSAFDTENLAFNHLLGFPLSIETIDSKAEHSITVGSGTFSLMEISYKVDRQTDYQSTDICVEVGSEDFGPYFASYSTSITNAGDLIDGDAEKTFLVPASSASSTETYYSEIEIGSACDDSSQSSYDIKYPEVKAGDLLTLLSIQFDIQATNTAAGIQDGDDLCLEFWKEGTLTQANTDTHGPILSADVVNKDPAKQFFYPGASGELVDLNFISSACRSQTDTALVLPKPNTAIPSGTFTPQ